MGVANCVPLGPKAHAEPVTGVSPLPDAASVAGATVSEEAMDDCVRAADADAAGAQAVQAGPAEAGPAEAGKGNGIAGHAPAQEVLDPQEVQGPPYRG